MEKLIEELKTLVPFKKTTDVGDIVLIVAENPQLVVYGLVTALERDHTRKDEWWQVSIRFLSIPPQPVVWILRTPQFTGQEIFTMGGEKRFVSAVDFKTALPPEPVTDEKSERQGQGKKNVFRIVK